MLYVMVFHLIVILDEGDIINVDVTAIVDEHYGDTSRMFCIGKTSCKSK